MFAGNLHTRTAVARLPLHQLHCLVLTGWRSTEIFPPSWNFSPRGVHPSSSHVLAVSSNLINGKPHITMDMTSWSIFYGKGCVSAGHFVMVIYMKYSCELYKTTGVLVCLSCVRRQVSVSASTCRNSRKSLPLRCKMRS